MTPTAALAGSLAGLRYADLPADVVEVARHCLLDWYGVTVAGSGEPAVALLRTVLAPPPGPSTLVGTGGRAAPEAAALVNGTAAHALDHDDVVPAMSGHPSAPVLAALLALAEPAAASGERLVTALVAGVQAACRVGRLVAPDHFGRGWHPTGTVGAIAAAAGCAHLLGLPPDGWRHALGLAATQAAGVRSAFGTMAKPLHAGRAAETGVLAARLAAAGYTADPDFLSSPAGWVATVAGGPAGAEPAGEPYEIRAVLFKRHAACYGATAALEAVASACRLHRIGPDGVRGIVLHVPERVRASCDRPRPASGTEAKFSLQHCAALAAAGRDTGPGGFTDAAVADPRLRELAGLVTVTALPGPAPSFRARAEVRTATGTVTAAADVGAPCPPAGLAGQRALLRAKFDGLAGPVLGPGRAAELAGLALTVDALADVRALARAAAGGEGLRVP